MQALERTDNTVSPPEFPPVSRRCNDVTIVATAISVIFATFITCGIAGLVLNVWPFESYRLTAAFSLAGLAFVVLAGTLINDLVLRKMRVVVNERGVFCCVKPKRGIRWEEILQVSLSDIWCERTDIFGLMGTPEVVVTSRNDSITFHRCLFHDDQYMLEFIRNHISADTAVVPEQWEHILDANPSETSPAVARFLRLPTKIWHIVALCIWGCVLAGSIALWVEGCQLRDGSTRILQSFLIVSGGAGCYLSIAMGALQAGHLLRFLLPWKK